MVLWVPGYLHSTGHIRTHPVATGVTEIATDSSISVGSRRACGARELVKQRSNDRLQPQRASDRLSYHETDIHIPLGCTI